MNTTDRADAVKACIAAISKLKDPRDRAMVVGILELTFPNPVMNLDQVERLNKLYADFERENRKGGT